MSVSGTLWLEEGWLLEDLHARVLGCTYREATWFVPLLRVELTRPLGGVPAGTRLTLRLNDYEGRGRWRVRWRWRLMLPGTRVVRAKVSGSEAARASSSISHRRRPGH